MSDEIFENMICGSTGSRPRWSNVLSLSSLHPRS